jgi:exonuclease SbcC
MQPLSLTLKGFRGIRDGLGRDALTLDLERLADGAELVAIAGANGRGKTTVMDNMHPYLTMPSRAAAAGPGGFSYYDHVCLPESEKDLSWAHAGRSYRSQVVVRTNGRRKTEAFLLVLDQEGAWKPVVLDDGTVSDGKVDTYTRCVEAICGSADTFFTSVFSAQGKRQLSAYRNGEIKTLLADLLGQEAIRAQGLRAAETARLLKASLGAMRQELAGVDEEGLRIANERGRLQGAEDRVARCLSERQAAQATLEVARQQQAQLLAEQDQSRSTEARRSQLQGECVAANQSSIQAIEALKAQDRGEQQRLDRLLQRVAHRTSQERSRRSALQDRRCKCLDALKQAQAVRRAERRLPLAEIVLAARVARETAWRQQVQCLTECQGAIRTAEQKLSATLREAGQAAIRADDLARRFGLTSAVPCAGTDLQGQCQLLGDAREASTMIPSAQAAIARLAREKASIDAELATLRSQREALAGAPMNLSRVEVACERARVRVTRLAHWSAKSAEIAQSRAALIEIDQELAAAASPGATDGQPVETTEEQAERHQIGATRQQIGNQIEQQSHQLRATLDRLHAALGAMPAAFDVQRLTEAKSAMDQAARGMAAAERTHLDAVRDAEALAALTVQAAALAARQARAASRIARVDTELSNWNLFARCMSNDGLIALAIDDAGPALSGLANDLLLACYGTRFTVSILTLLETGKGDQKEGFDIVVHDGESGESKSVGLMSGGERVFVNECLIRAVALYLAQHTGRQYDTLFSDEADGPLDPERKRMFMAMKREVLKLGGYAREFFVSQTPELTAMADAVIDLEVFAAARDSVVAA